MDTMSAPLRLEVPEKIMQARLYFGILTNLHNSHLLHANTFLSAKLFFQFRVNVRHLLSSFFKTGIVNPQIPSHDIT